MTGVQILYDRPQGAQPRSPGVVGDFTAADALSRLLAGTGLAARFADPHDVLLTSAETAPRSPPTPAERPPPVGPRLALDTLEVNGPRTLGGFPVASMDPRLYAGLIQDEVRQALAVDPKAGRGDYRATLELWIAQDGRIRDTRVVTTSGEAARDAAIIAALRNLKLEPPPTNLPQPARLQVRSRPDTRCGRC